CEGSRSARSIMGKECGAVESCWFSDDGDVGDHGDVGDFLNRSSPRSSCSRESRTDSVVPPTPMRKRSEHSKNRPGTIEVSNSARKTSQSASTLPDFSRGKTIVPYSGQK